MRRLHLLLPGVVVLVAASFAAAADHTGNTTIQFKFDFPNSNPSHYEITVTNDGHGTYTSDGLLSAGASSNPEPLQFTLSQKTREDLFDLARRAKYFTGKIDSGNKKIANTGVKTLTYQDGSHQTSATYNYSPNPSVQQVTEIFQNLSTVLEYGRRLSYFYKYEKLALDDDLKQMEERQRDGTLGDVAAIAPLLKQIADDHSVMNISRERALRLLAVAGL